MGIKTTTIRLDDALWQRVQRVVIEGKLGRDDLPKSMNEAASAALEVALDDWERGLGE